jgi:hypothetical protein
VGLNLPRSGHTATSLNDGRILVVGGSGVTTEPNTQAEIFDSTTSTTASAWTCSRVGSLTVNARVAHTATLLTDGRVLIAGGSSSGNTAELFDPSGGSVATEGVFTATGNLMGGYLSTNTNGRNQHAAVLLTAGANMGKVLLTGGQGSTAAGVAQSAEIFDPSSGTFSNAAATVTPMNSGRVGHLLVVLNDGTVMALGGNAPQISVTGSTELYDPVLNAWTSIGPPARNNATLTTFTPTGKIILVGGQGERQGTDSLGNSLAIENTSRVYDPATGLWTDLGVTLKNARYQHSAVMMGNKLLVAGGVSAKSSIVLNSVEVYDGTSWTTVAAMNVARTNFGLITLPNGNVLAVGGQSATSASWLSSAEVYNGASWTLLGTGLGEAKSNITPVLLMTNGIPNGQVAVAGGITGTTSSAGGYGSKVDIFDQGTSTWTAMNDLPAGHARVKHFTIAMPDGRFVLLGGSLWNAQITGSSAAGVGGFGMAIDIYDPAANGGTGGTTSSANNYFTTNAGWSTNPGSTYTVLPNGQIMLVAGTLNSTNLSSNSEIYALPPADTLTPGPTLTAGNGSGVLSATLPNGDFMLVGGSQTNSVTQIYRAQ